MNLVFAPFAMVLGEWCLVPAVIGARCLVDEARTIPFLIYFHDRGAWCVGCKKDRECRVFFTKYKNHVQITI